MRALERLFEAGRSNEKRAGSGGYEGEGEGGAASFLIADLGFEPEAEARIGEDGFIVPEAGFEAALDAQMIELQLNLSKMAGKVLLRVALPDEDSGYAATAALRCDNHRLPPFDQMLVEDYRQRQTCCLGVGRGEIPKSQPAHMRQSC